VFRDPNTLQVRIALADIKPEIWRQLLVPIDWNLKQLHLAIQAAFNWWNYHLSEFYIGGLRFGDVPLLTEDAHDDDQRVFDFVQVRLRDFEPRSRLVYLYDFGDGWKHRIEFEELIALDDPPKHAVCIAGARARPPEDVGGTKGYKRFLKAIRNERDPRHDELLEWCRGHFDPEWFHLDVVNKDLRTALKPNVRRELYQPHPTRKASG
jgi:hypothetical protein